MTRATGFVARGFVWLGVAAAAFAEGDATEEKWLKSLEEALESGQAAYVVRGLDTEGVADMLAGNPAGLRRVCAAAESHVADIAKAGFEPARGAAEKLLAIAERARTGNEKSDDAHWSAALARVARGRIVQRTGGKPSPDDWRAAAASLEKAYELDAEAGAPLAVAASYLIEAALLPGADAPKILEQASGVADRVLKVHAGEPRALQAAAMVRLERARRCLPADKAGATAQVSAGLALLAPHVAKEKPDVDLATTWNDLVALNVAEKLKQKAEFCTTKVRAGADLEFMVPVSRHWKSEEGESEPTVVQLARDLTPLRSCTLYRYKWTVAYQFGGRDEAGGDNIKGLCTMDMESAARDFRRADVKKGPVKGRLNAHVPAGYYYEVSGMDSKGAPKRVRSWFWKSEEGHQQTYNFHVVEWQVEDFDPQAQVFVDSVTELKKR